MVIKSVIPYLLASLVSFSACAEKPSAADLPSVTVYKSPSCGCCVKWVEHMRKAGFEVTVNDVDNVHPVKMRVGVPPAKGSCHTSEVAGYFLEGHAGIGRKAAARGAAGRERPRRARYADGLAGHGSAGWTNAGLRRRARRKGWNDKPVQPSRGVMTHSGIT